jgi:general secretion pathway protein G
MFTYRFEYAAHFKTLHAQADGLMLVFQHAAKSKFLLSKKGSLVQTMNTIHREHGLTLIEIITVVAIIGVLSGIAIPSYLAYRDKTSTEKAIADINNIEARVMEYWQEHGDFPLFLSDVGLSGLKDPWGNPYEYWPITGDKHQKVRKDRNTHPINTDFDLYSKGKDGDTNFPLTAHASQDDIIRANNGAYIGLASNY